MQCSYIAQWNCYAIPTSTDQCSYIAQWNCYAILLAPVGYLLTTLATDSRIEHARSVTSISCEKLHLISSPIDPKICGHALHSPLHKHKDMHVTLAHLLRVFVSPRQSNASLNSKIHLSPHIRNTALDLNNSATLAMYSPSPPDPFPYSTPFLYSRFTSLSPPPSTHEPLFLLEYSLVPFPKSLHRLRAGRITSQHNQFPFAHWFVAVADRVARRSD